MHCDSCGRENPAGSRFCLHCGAALAEGGSGASTTVVLKAGVDEFTSGSDLPDPGTDAHAAFTLGSSFGSRGQVSQ